MEYSYSSSKPRTKTKNQKERYVMYNKYSRIDTILIGCLSYYSQNKESLQKLKDVIDPVKMENKRKISLRVFDYFVTTYSKTNNLSIGENFFNVHSEYKSQLFLYNKNFFDPFCRVQKKNSYTKIELNIDIDTNEQDFCVLNENVRPDLALGLNSKSVIVVNIETEDFQLRVSLGQLNFFKWAIETGVYEYICNNIKSITI